MSIATAVAYVLGSGVDLLIPSTTAGSESGWGAVSVGFAYAFTPTAATPPVSATSASSYVYGGFFGGVSDTPIVLASAIVQGNVVDPPAPSGQQLSFFWSTG